MNRTTAILNLKGGVAKTTTAINMAAILAQNYKSHVLLIDADSQCNLTEFYGGDSSKGNLADLLRDSTRADHAESFIQETTYPSIDILPGDESLMDMDLSKVERGTADAAVLRKLRCSIGYRYQHILIDCPPAFNAASAAALIAADDVIIPIKLDAFSLRGMGNLMRQIANMRTINPNLKLAGCLPTMWYKSEQIQQAEEQLRGAGLPIYHHIRKSDTVDRMTWQQDPLLISSPTSGAGVDYKRFVAEYIVGGVHHGL